MNKNYQAVEAALQRAGRIPYNNLRPLFDAKAEHLPEKMGGSCIFGADYLVEELAKEGIGATYLESWAPQDETRFSLTHFPVLVKTDNLLYADPFLVQQKPINVTEVLQGQEQEVSSFPQGTIIKAAVEGDDMLSIKQYFLGSQTNGYLFSLADTHQTAPSNQRDDVNMKQTYLQLRQFVGEDSLAFFLMSPNTGSKEVRVISPTGMQKLEENTEGYQPIVEEIAQKTDVTLEELNGYFALAREIHNDLFE